jgi:hypothetical protein
MKLLNEIEYAEVFKPRAIIDKLLLKVEEYTLQNKQAPHCVIVNTDEYYELKHYRYPTQDGEERVLGLILKQENEAPNDLSK